MKVPCRGQNNVRPYHIKFSPRAT